MTDYLKNSVVEVIPLESDIFAISNGNPVGKIILSRKEGFGEIYFEIEPSKRGLHYASNGVYLFSKYAHDVLGINFLHAYIPKENDIAKHVVEHSGYHISVKDDKGTLYIHDVANTRKDDDLKLDENQKSLYLAGGCFWGMERVFKVLDGVISTKVGYANGTVENPTYEDIIRNETGYKETVRVIYDESVVSTATVLKAYFMCIDPTLRNQQAHDYGTQYQTGVYYRDESLLSTIEEVFEQEKKKHAEFYVELKPLESFYEAEEYHQNYLDKNVDGYCHITLVDIKKVKELNKK